MQRRWLIIGGIVVLSILLLVGVGITWWLLQRSAAEIPAAPLAEEGNLPNAPGAPPTSPEPPAPIASYVPSPKLAVNVSYVRNETFSLQIVSVERTDGPSTIEHFAPRLTDPASVIEVVDAEGVVLSRQAFTFPTQLIADALEEQTGLVPLAENKETLVIPVAVGTQPAGVRIVAPQSGVVMAQQAFVYSELPVKESFEIPRQSWWRRWFLREAQAQSSGHFIIVVTSTAGAEGSVAQIVANTKQMVNTLEPWKTYAGRVDVIAVPNSTDLGCTTETIGATGYPRCSVSAAINAVEPRVAEWHTIIVATTVPCSCGTVSAMGSGVTAVGSQAGSMVIGHELGHAVGRLADEYYYQLGQTGPSGPNCFASQSACESANEPFAGNAAAVCSPGCNNTSTWRPATQLMHLTLGSPPQYGPFEECEMRKVIAETLGEGGVSCGQPEPEPEETPGPSAPPPPDRPGDYWGGGR
jgi:hypothetical protein